MFIDADRVQLMVDIKRQQVQIYKPKKKALVDAKEFPSCQLMFEKQQNHKDRCTCYLLESFLDLLLVGDFDPHILTVFAVQDPGADSQ